MSLSSGDHVGRYEILCLVGKGGMGEVYKARDTALDRTVAIKRLHETVLTRFEREARAIAQLQHPSICAVYDIGPDFLVLEFIEGATLRERIASGPLPAAEAMDITEQIALALGEAHRRGLVHRDVKPANIMLTPQNQAKLMDFGLAKMTRTPEADDATASVSLTAAGAVLGTPVYMPPEQLLGRGADARSDIWSIGVVLYEMLAGRTPFADNSRSTAAAALSGERLAPLRSIRRDVAAGIDAVVARALETNPDQRYQTIDEFLSDLRRVRVHKQSRRLWWYAAAACAILAAIGITVWVSSRQVSQPARVSMEQITALPDNATSPAISPDGKLVAFIRGPESFVSAGEIYIKMLPNGQPVQLTHDGSRKMGPIFSPDGTRIAYTVVTERMSWDTWTVPVLGGEPRPWLINASGLSWTGPGRILYSEIRTGMHMVLVAATESRTEARDVYVPKDIRGMAHRSALSPDGRWVLVVEMDRTGFLPCRLAPFDGSSEGHPVGPLQGQCTCTAWSPDGRWMFFTSTATGKPQLWRQRFPDGAPEQLTFGPSAATGVSPAPDGRSVVASVGLLQRSVWVHENGREREVSSEGDAILPAWGDGFPGSVFSPEGDRVYYLVKTGRDRGFGGGELWFTDLKTGSAERFLPGLSVNSFDVCAEGKHIVYSAVDPAGKTRAWLVRSDRGAPPRQLTGMEAMGSVFGRDEEVYFRGPEGSDWFIFAAAQDSSKVRKVAPEPAVNAPTVSPDGEWVISTVPTNSGESSSVVKAFPTRSGEARVLCGRCFPKWTRDGRFLFLAFTPNQGMGDNRTYVIKLSPGRALPELPKEGLNTAADLQKLPLAAVIDRLSVFPGRSEGEYAYMKQNAHQNLHRILLF